MGTLIIPEFMLLGQIVKKEDSACSLLQNSDATAAESPKRSPRTKDYLNSPSGLHKPSLCCIYEEPSKDEEAATLADGDDSKLVHDDKDDAHCGFSLLAFLSFIICPFS